MKGPERAFSQEVALETDGLGETAPLQEFDTLRIVSIVVPFWGYLLGSLI